MKKSTSLRGAQRRSNPEKHRTQIWITSCFAVRNDEQKISRRDRIFVEISPQPKAACGAAAVFQVICGNPHVMHKEMSFLPSDASRRDAGNE
jgi:hypothetical protein